MCHWWALFRFIIDLLYTHTIHFTVHLRSVLAYPRTHGSSDAAMLGCATHVPHPQRACLSTTSTVYSCHFISRASDCATSACGMQIVICRQPWLAGATNSSAWSSWNSHSTAASCEAPATHTTTSIPPHSATQLQASAREQPCTRCTSSSIGGVALLMSHVRPTRAL